MTLCIPKQARALALATLASLVAVTGARATEVQLAVEDVDTSVKRLTLAAGEAFAFDQDELSEAGSSKLDAIMADLQDEYVYRIDVIGYTDKVGDEKYNLDLSFRRAQAVVTHLKMQGVLPERIKPYAMGSADPVVTCGDMPREELIACLAPNRRTEVHFSFPRLHTEAVLHSSLRLASQSGGLVGVSTPVASSEFAAQAAKVFIEGCRSDLDAYCSQVTPGDQRLLACLYAHDDKLSERCRVNVLDALLIVEVELAQTNQIGAMCGSDILTHCVGVEPGDGRIATCLQRNSGLLSQGCREAIQSLPR